MKRSIARKWAKALESGDYKQGFGQLRKGDKFCALGVLCNIHAQEHPEIAAKQKFKSKYLGIGGVLPREVQYWAWMDSNDGSFSWYDSVLEMNDTEKNTFAEIAKVIRKEWKKL